jgi:D-glycero-D-manno-heptose 1,7-bisphosphate phosphatase
VAESKAARPAVFLDRDGTLNREVDYLSRADEFEFLPGVPTALARLAQAGFALVVVTNQSGIARGKLDEATLGEIHRRMEQELAAEGVQLDGIEFCPHHPKVGPPAYRRTCGCRKPAPGMLLVAAAAHDLDLARSWTIGDSGRDLEAGHAAGTRAILVLTGKGRQELARLEGEGARPGLVAEDLVAAVELILASC